MNKITVEQVEACISNGTTIITNSRLLLRNLFQLEYQNVNRNAYVTGIGDFLRGAYSVWQICKVLNVKYELYLHNHPMGKYFIAQDKNREIAKLSVPAFLTVTYPDVRRTFISFVISHLSSESINVGANFFPVESVSIPEEYRNFVRQYLQPVPSLLQSYLNKGGLAMSQYAVIHVRAGDPINGPVDSNLLDKVRKVIDRVVIPHVAPTRSYIISDRLALRDILSQTYGFRTLAVNTICHSTNSAVETDSLALEGTLIDMLLLTHAKAVYSFSNSIQFWGTGFSHRVAQLYNIPICIGSF